MSSVYLAQPRRQLRVQDIAHPEGVIAIDPGAVSGAYAALSDWELVVGDLPTVDGNIDVPALAALIRRLRCQVAIVEIVGPMPKQGISSTGKFMRAVGRIEGTILTLGLSLTRVAPSQWKASHGLLNRDKDAARSRALELYPHVAHHLARKRDVGRADSILMLDWLLCRRARV
jgi:crossover junction endodeoxyribonuclease RuvC